MRTLMRGFGRCLDRGVQFDLRLHLRGNATDLRGNVSGVREGGKVFGQGSRAPVAITIWSRTRVPHTMAVASVYRDIGDYLSREQKLKTLRETGSISGISEWQTITPDEHHDWVRQRSDVFSQFYPIGTTDAKTGVADDAIFRLYSLGLATGRDPYIYNFSRDACGENGRRMTADYLAAISELEQDPNLPAAEAARRHSSNIKWNRELEKNLQRQREAEYNQGFIRRAAYRPFVASNCYTDYTFIQMKYLMDRIFPDRRSENRVICVSGKGGTKGFSALLSDRTTDLQFMFNGQCFPRYRYQVPTEDADTIDALEGISDRAGRIDNISDTALRVFCEHYHDDTITKDAIFDYVYGVLHAPSYGTEFANDLSKDVAAYPVRARFLCVRRGGESACGTSPRLRDDVNGIRWSSYSHMKGNRTRGIFD